MEIFNFNNLIKDNTLLDKIISEIYNNNLIFASPTDTLYGLSAVAFSEIAVRKIFTLKNRDFSKKFILLASDLEMVCKYVEIDNDTKIKLSNIWPAELTCIFKAKNLPDYLVEKNGSIAFRVPNHPIRNFIEKINVPIISASANPEGEKPASNIDEIINYFDNKLDYIFDDGIIENTLPSTIISFYPEKQVIRKGFIDINLFKF